MPLSIHHIPLTFTFAIIEDKENSAVCIDPSVLSFINLSMRKRSFVKEELP